MSIRSHLQAKNLPKSKKAPWKALSCELIKDLGKKIKEAFNWKHAPRPFQLEAIKAQLQRKDVIVHASTGAGKTMIVAGPHALEAMKGKVTILVSPLIALQEEQVIMFQEEFNLKAIAINSANGGLTKEKIKDIQEGKYAVVIASPKMVLSKTFIAQIIRHRAVWARILAVVIDEAHVVSHWGSGFRKKYGTLGILKALLPCGTSFVVLSATLPPRVRNDIIKKLQLNQNEMVSLNLGNDRPNVSLVVRAMQSPMNSYRDLDFVIPRELNDPQQIKKTFIYADSIAVATAMEDHLYELCPDRYRYTGFIRPYSAAFSTNYRAGVMKLFRDGKVRVLICTDAAGMGCNIPDIDVVIQWKLPASISAFVQRAGRAARGEGRTGLAVLLVEKAVYEADVVKYMESQKNSQAPAAMKSRKVTVCDSVAYPKASKEYAKARGVLRGGHAKESDNTHLPIDVPVDELSLDEGLYTLAQTGMCRRKILTAVFRNDTPSPLVPCCDICVPSLLDLTRPSPSTVDKRESIVKRGVPNIDIMRALHSWRVEIARRDFSNALFMGSGILGNDIVELLSSVGPIKSMDKLKLVLGSQWSHWFQRYGTELLTTLQHLTMAPMQPKPRKTTGKRATEASSEQRRASKKSRVVEGNDRCVRPGEPSSALPPVNVTCTRAQPHGSSNVTSASPQQVPATPARNTSPSLSSARAATGTLTSNNPYMHLLSTPLQPYTPYTPAFQVPTTPLNQSLYSSSPNTLCYPTYPAYYYTPRPPPPGPPPPST